MSSDVSLLLSAIQRGESRASAELLPLVYNNLRQMARLKLAHEPAGQTLQATALVHEAYLRLVDVPVAQKWDSRKHFFGAAAELVKLRYFTGLPLPEAAEMMEMSERSACRLWAYARSFVLEELSPEK